MEREQIQAVEVFYSYAYRDEFLRNELEKHLMNLSRQGRIINWHNHRITAGKEWAQEIDMHINTAQLILLLISPDFLASDYCYELEMKRALERHKADDALVIPILLRPVDWKDAPFGQLQALPMNGKPITSWSGRNGRDKAFLEVTLGIRTAIDAITGRYKIANIKDPTTTTAALFQTKALAFFHTSKAEMLYGRGFYEEALAFYEEALRLDPNDTDSYIGKGDALYKLGRYEEALAFYEEALRLDPNDTDSYIGKGDTLYKLERYEEALAFYEEALRLDPNNVDAYDGKTETLVKLHYDEEILFTLSAKAKSFSILRRYEEALVIYERALHLDANNLDALLGKASVFSILGRPKEALVIYERALHLDANNLDALLGKAPILHSLAHHEEALAIYDQILRLDAKNLNILLKKASVLYELRRDEEARATMNQVSRLIN